MGLVPSSMARAADGPWLINLKEETRDRLHPDLNVFLEFTMMAEEAFFVFAGGINDPSDTLEEENPKPDEAEGDADRLVVLYNTNIGLVEHQVGLLSTKNTTRPLWPSGSRTLTRPSRRWTNTRTCGFRWRRQAICYRYMCRYADIHHQGAHKMDRADPSW